MSSEEMPKESADGFLEDLSWFQKPLAALLEPDEEVVVRLEGVDLSGLVCTDRRVIVFHTGHFTWFLGNVKSFHATYDHITGVSMTQSLRIQPLLGGGHIFEVITPEMDSGATLAGSMFEFAAEPNRIGFEKGKGDVLKRVVAFVEQKIATTPRVARVASVSAVEAPAAESPLKTLEKLAALKAEGLLTEEEFQAQKRKVLERL
jgi:hypothetical protein